MNTLIALIATVLTSLHPGGKIHPPASCNHFNTATTNEWQRVCQVDRNIGERWTPERPRHRGDTCYALNDLVSLHWCHRPRPSRCEYWWLTALGGGTDVPPGTQLVDPRVHREHC